MYVLLHIDHEFPYNSDTVTRSGMFCAMATVIDRCKTEGVGRKALCVQKPGAVPMVVSLHACLDE